MQVPGRLKTDVSEATLDAIASAVAEAESKTSGEIVVHLVRGLLPLEKSRARAVRTFLELGVDRTAKRNAVLLFVVMKQRRFEIVADEGIDREVGRESWEEIAERTSAAIEHDGFAKGICRGVAWIGEVLEKHFPREPGDVNELANRPRTGGE